MQAYAPGVLARGVVEAAAAGEAAAAAAVVEAVEAAAFRRIDKNPTYFYDRIMGMFTEMVTVVIHHHLFRILSMVPE